MRDTTSGLVTIRPAVADLDEGMAYARYLNVAAGGAFRGLLGRSYDQVIGQAYLSPGHDLSYETAAFAEHSGEIAGMAAGFTSHHHEHSSDEPLRRAAGLRMLRMDALSLLWRGMKSFIETVGDGDYYLLAVAVDERHRGEGIGSRLLDHAEQVARASGCDRIVLDVVEKNIGARQLYARRGMSLEATSPRVLFMPNTRACRMVKQL